MVYDIKDCIMQGTTPELRIKIPDTLKVTEAVAVELYVLNGYSYCTYKKEDLTLDEETNSIVKRFTEEETAKYTPGRGITVQARLWFADGTVGIKKISIGVSDMIGVGADG